jgi:hypothetical protein
MTNFLRLKAVLPACSRVHGCPLTLILQDYLILEQLLRVVIEWLPEIPETLAVSIFK